MVDRSTIPRGLIIATSAVTVERAVIHLTGLPPVRSRSLELYLRPVNRERKEEGVVPDRVIV